MPGAKPRPQASVAQPKGKEELERRGSIRDQPQGRGSPCVLWGHLDKPAGSQRRRQGAGPGVQVAAGGSGQRSECCFALRSPPEGALAPAPLLARERPGPAAGSALPAHPLRCSLHHRLDTPGGSSVREQAWVS